MRAPNRAIGAAMILAASTAFAAPPAIALAASPPVQRAAAAATSLDSAFASLIAAIHAVPKSDIRAPGYRDYLLTKARIGQSEADRGRLCLAEGTLAQMRGSLSNAAEAGAPGSGGPLVDPLTAVTLEAEVIGIQAMLLSVGGTGACGGSAQPASPVPSPLVKIVSSDNMQITFHVTFPTPAFVARMGNGVPYLEMFGPNMGDISSLFSPGRLKAPGGAAVGRPELPGTGVMLAVPLGGSTTVKVLGTSSFMLPGVLLWPFQPPAPAAANLPPLPPPPSAFTINRAAYLSSAPYPSSLAMAGALGSMHGLNVGAIAIAGAQYRPARQMLTVLTGMDVKVSFGGSTSNVFGTSHLLSPSSIPFKTLWQSSLLNWATVAQYITSIPAGLLCGEEMMVITSPALESVASQFATQRSSQGVATRYFLTGNQKGQIGTSLQQIRDFIGSEYNNTHCWVTPSYVLLLGDTTVVPTFEISMGLHGDSNSKTGFSPNFPEDPIATDMPYGFIHQAGQVDSSLTDGFDEITDYNQDLYVGRVPVPLVNGNAGQPNTGAASAEMSLIETYESTPPNGLSSFYRNVTGAEFFQPCPAVGSNCGNGSVTPSTQDLESFLRSSEFVGTEAQFANKAFDRVANDEQDNDPAVTINPQTFDDGTGIPSGINWNGGASDITSAVNAGTFLLWHSDHGYTNGVGWYEPAFDLNHVFSANPPAGELPVVWSSDCDSGKFDSQATGLFPYTAGGVTPSYSESWLEYGHGVGSVGSSRESFIFWDGYMLKGMGTSLFPEEGNIWRAFLGISPVGPVTELGQLLDAAKAYMEAETGADLTGDIGAQGTVLEYNDFGDPSMPIWRDSPIFYANTHLITLSSNVFQVSSSGAGTDGTLVSLVSDRTLIGQGEMQGGTVQVTTSESLSNLAGTVYLSRDGFITATFVLSPQIK